MSAWAAGENAEETIIDFVEGPPHPGINPFTKRPMGFRNVKRKARGRLILKTQ
jgi:hypothetical protein